MTPRYKPTVEKQSGMNVYIGDGTTTDVGTLRMLTLQRVTGGADATTYQTIQDLVYTMSKAELLKRMHDFEAHGDYDLSPVRPEADLVW